MGLTRLVVPALVLALLAAGGWACYMAGKRAERAVCAATETARVSAIAERMVEQLERSAALDAEVEQLRARPERIRTVTREVQVHADADCRSLPESVRILWRAGADPDPPASAAAVGNAGMP